MPSNPNQLMPTDFGPMQFAPIFGRNAQAPQQLPTPAPPNPFRLLRGAQDQGRGFPMPQPLGPPGIPGGRSNLALGQDVPMDLPEQAQFPSGFDPAVRTPGSISYGGPRLNTSEALGGLQAAQPRPLGGLGVYGSEEELYKRAFQSPSTEGMEVGNAPWSMAMAQRQLGLRNQDEDFNRKRQQTTETAVGDALTGQHPAIQGLQELESQRKALPQQLEAQGRILAEREQAKGLVGGAQANAAGRQQAAALQGLAPLWAQLGEAQERAQQSAVDNLDEFAGPNQQAITALQQAIANYYQMLGFTQPQ